MAGDWILMRTGLATERATLSICDATGLDQFQVVGRLHAIWSWADSHTVTGAVTGVTLKTIDRIVCAQGFAEAMVAAKWLESDENGVLKFPKWKTYNTKSAKERQLAAQRSAKYRERKSRVTRDGDRDASVTNHGTTEQNRTVHNRMKETPLPPSTGNRQADQVLATWLAYKAERREPYKPVGLKQLVSRIKNQIEKHGLDAVTEAMQRAMAANYKGWDFKDSFGNAEVDPESRIPTLESIKNHPIYGGQR